MNTNRKVCAYKKIDPTQYFWNLFWIHFKIKSELNLFQNKKRRYSIDYKVTSLNKASKLIFIKHSFDTN